MKKDDYKSRNSAAKVLPSALLAIALAAITVILINIKGI